jgi:uncharacterized membrane protein
MIFLRIVAPSEWVTFFGHFHPVFVHLPIGMLVIAAMMEIVTFSKKKLLFDNALSFTFFWGFVSAFISCVFGWCLSTAGGYEENTLSWHKWLGITVCIVSGVCWYLKKNAHQFCSVNKLYRSLLFLLTVLLTVTGHLGGSITHGEDYLTADTPSFIKKIFGIAGKGSVMIRPPITNVNDAAGYKEIIEPILEKKCWNCHSASKVKGRLRMDKEELLLRGGEHGIVINANNANESELIKRLLLPLGDDNRMPPKGKPSVTANEIKLLTWWINNGTDFKKKVKEIPQDDEVKKILASLESNKLPGNGNVQTNKTDTTLKLFNKKIPQANNSDVEALKLLKVMVVPIAQGQFFLEVSCVTNPAFSNDNMKLMVKLSQQITWLKMSDTKITDKALLEIGRFENLVKLDLKGTAITNAGMAFLNGLKNLEYINLTGTKIDDEGLLQLAAIKTLKTVYCWNTNVTNKGMDALKKKIDGLSVDMGNPVLN